MTKQAYYHYYWYSKERRFEQELILQEVLKIKESHRRMGGRKLFVRLEPFMPEHRIKMGRDAFFDLLATHHLLIRRRNRRVRTIHSFHWLRKYPNLIKEVVPTRTNQLWVSDITYRRIETDFLYIILLPMPSLIK